MSDKRSKKNKGSKSGSLKQKPLVECKAFQLGKWVLGHELNNDFLSLIRAHIENTIGSHRNDTVTKTRLRFFQRGLATGDKPSLLSFGLEQFYPIEDIKTIARDERHTNVVFCVIKPPSLVYEVLAFRCPTEYEARQFAENFKKVKDQSGTGFNIDLKDPPDGQELNWSMKTSELKRIGDVNALSNANGNTYESVHVSERNGDLSTVHIDKQTKTMHITSSGYQGDSQVVSSGNDEELYSTIDLQKKRADREAALNSQKKTTTTTTVTEETVAAPSQTTEEQTTTTVVKSTVDEPVMFELDVPKAQQVQQETFVTREANMFVPAQTHQQTTVVKEANVVIPSQHSRVVRETNIVAAQPQTQQNTTVVREFVAAQPQTQQNTTVVREFVAAQPQTQQSTRVVREFVAAQPQTQQNTTVVREFVAAQPQTQQNTTVVREMNVVAAEPQTRQQTTVVREALAVPPQNVQQHRVVRETKTLPATAQSKVVRETQVIPSQQTTKVVKEVHSTPKQQTKVVREVQSAQQNSKMSREVEYNEVAVLNARIISLEQENKYLRELLKVHSVNDRDLDAFMRKETVMNGPQIDSVVLVGDRENRTHQTVKHSKHGQTAITVADYRNTMSRTDSDRSIGSFVKTRKHRGGAGMQVMDNYVSGSLRSQQSGSLYASPVRGSNTYIDQNMYAQVHRVHNGPHHAHRALNLHHHQNHHGDIITHTMATPNSGYLIVPQGTYKKSASHGHTYITKPIDEVYAQPIMMPADEVNGSLSDDDDDDQVFEIESPKPVKIV